MARGRLRAVCRSRELHWSSFLGMSEAFSSPGKSRDRRSTGLIQNVIAFSKPAISFRCFENFLAQYFPVQIASSPRTLARIVIWWSSRIHWSKSFVAGLKRSAQRMSIPGLPDNAAVASHLSLEKGPSVLLAWWSLDLLQRLMQYFTHARRRSGQPVGQAQNSTTPGQIRIT